MLNGRSAFSEGAREGGSEALLQAVRYNKESS